MQTINLKNFYKWVNEDIFVEITDEMLEAMKAADRQEASYARQARRYKAYYSLELYDGLVEGDVVQKVPSPEEIYISEEIRTELFASISKLSDIQQLRILLYFYEGMTYRKIAEIEGTTHSTVGRSIKSALEKLNVFLKYKQ